ncbi:hypothetical protein [Halomonas aquatica]|uniref:Uncharacterized protein n=1 Tax=Halomonas aquatica TaxID=3151123 RepID=A0ABV1NE57_9GAMM
MDEELMAIQADLDSVLDRLAEYMSSDKLESVIEAHPSSRKDAARVALHYASTHHLICSIEISRIAKFGPSSNAASARLGVQTEGLPSEHVELLEALMAVVDSGGTSWPLEDEHLEALRDAVTAWADKECQFIGESAGLTLTPKREVDRRKRARTAAARDAYNLHNSDPRKYPVDEALFEEAGKRYGMSSRTVSRAYYSQNFHKPPASRERLKRAILSIMDKT